MYKVLISGYYGFNNIGDDSILRAVLSSLDEKLDDIDVTVLSSNPESTEKKFGVKAVTRKRFATIVNNVRKCDLLISGGGSLLQDATSKKSILYYLAIMWIAFFFRKKVFIYSQGIGPIYSKFNRWLTAKTLRKADGIVVRDAASKELLAEIGVPFEDVVVTADPVIRMNPVPLDSGKSILVKEGFERNGKGPVVGFAIRERKLSSEFISELCISMQSLISKYDAQIVLIPFFHAEDLKVLEEIENRMGDNVSSIKNKYLTDEMLSIIGNMDILVGVRLHSLIYAAIMDIPMIAISYDPKVNSFMHSLDMKAMSALSDFRHDFFIDEFENTMNKKDEIREVVRQKVAKLSSELDTNETMIKELIYE